MLLEAIHIASRAVSNKTTIAILEGLRITAGENLTFTGYNLSIGIKTTVDADIIEAGEIVLNAKLFGDIIRKLPDDIVYIETNSNLQTTIRCGRAAIRSRPISTVYQFLSDELDFREVSGVSGLW